MVFFIPDDKSFPDQARLAKMAGRWARSGVFLFLCIFLAPETQSRAVTTQKKNLATDSAILDLTSGQ